METPTTIPPKSRPSRQPRANVQPCARGAGPEPERRFAGRTQREFAYFLLAHMDRPGWWQAAERHVGEPGYEFITSLYLDLMREITPTQLAAFRTGKPLHQCVWDEPHVKEWPGYLRPL